MRLVSTAGGILFVTVLAAGSARADWPSARHDPQRTAVSPASSDITKPAVYWKAYVGGYVGPQQFLAADVNGDGRTDFVYVSGGAVYAKNPDGSVLWRTPLHDLQSVYAIDDFDGDGHPDVLAAGVSQAFLLSGSDGSFEWVESSSDLGAMGGLRVADFNGDGRPDLLSEECHCCGLSNGASAFAYSFARGAAGVLATQLFTLPTMTGDFTSCGVPTVIFDPNGDGKVAIAHAGDTHMYVIGTNGEFLVDAAQSPALGQMLYEASCYPANVDGIPGDELVCFQARVYGVEPTPRQVFVLRYDSSTSPSSLDLLWQNTTLAPAGLDAEPMPVVDLDGDGTMEVVVSGMSAAGQWTTYIFDGKSGTTLATIPSARTAGTAPLRSDGKVDVLTSDGQNLTAWVYDPSNQPGVRQTWTETDRRTMTQVDPALLRTIPANTTLVTPAMNADGTPDLVTLTVSAGSVLYEYSAPGDTATQLGTFTFPSDVDPIATWTVPPTTETYDQVAMVGNDGLLRLFDAQLSINGSLQVGGACEGGIRASPVLASMGGVGGTQSLFVSDSRKALLRFDAQNASLANPPQAQWTARNCAEPSVMPGLDGARPGIVCQGAQQPITYPTQPALTAVRGDGSIIWNTPMPSPVVDDALPGTTDASGAPSVLVHIVDSENNLSTWSISGSTGLPNWSTTPTAVAWGYMPLSVADWNGDGVDDVISVVNYMQAVSGSSGQTLIEGTNFLGYGVPILSDVDGNGVLEATLQGGYYPAQLLEHDLQTTSWTGANTQPYPNGAIASCSGGSQLVEGSDVYPSRLYFTQVTGQSAGQSGFTVFAGGKEYMDEAKATAAGAYLGQLSDLAIEANLTGSGSPTAVVGSTDGWLYAVDACSGKLQFALDMQESVCGAIFGDTNADGRDEILVSTSGGYVYDVQNEELGGCGPVLDVDPPGGITDREVSQIVSQSTLFGAWQAVAGAASYQVAVTHEPEGIISDPPWQDVGSGTSAAVTGLPLIVGQTYYFAVHAVGPQGSSVDAISPGVTVVAAGTVDAGAAAGAGSNGAGPDATAGSAGAGCGCEAVGSAGPEALPGLVGIALGLGIAVGRRRRS